MADAAGPRSGESVGELIEIEPGDHSPASVDSLLDAGALSKQAP